MRPSKRCFRCFHDNGVSLPTHYWNSHNNNNNNNNSSSNTNHSYSKSLFSSSSSRTSTSSFLDKLQIQVRGGKGGKGCISYETRSRSHYKKRPNGGHGGNGGNVIFVASPDVKPCLRPILTQYQQFRKGGRLFVGRNGENGNKQCQHGRNGKDVVIYVPCGVIVRELQMHDDHDEYDNHDEYNENWEDEENDKKENEDSNWDWDSEEEEMIHHDEKSERDELYEFQLTPEEIQYEQQKQQQKQQQQLSSSSSYSQEYHDIVNTGIRAQDGMYHWSPPPPNTTPSPTNPHYHHHHHEPQIHPPKRAILADLDEANTYIIAAKGGRGGTGNSIFASRSHHSSHKHTAQLRILPTPPTFTHLELELKLIADIGLVGYPNAGKSTVLHAVSRAKPKIAPYPFTTLHPLVGCLEYQDGLQIRMADVPGLIDGAASGRGRGMDFLRHLERTKVLMYIVDASLGMGMNMGVDVDERNPVRDFQVLVKELSLYDQKRLLSIEEQEQEQHQDEDDDDIIEYNDTISSHSRHKDWRVNHDNDGGGGMMTRPALVIVNKMDLLQNEKERQEVLSNVGLAVKEAGIQIQGNVMGISAGETGEGLQELSKVIRETVLMARGGGY